MSHRSRQKILNLLSIALILCASITFAQAPSRKDAAAEYCLVHGDRFVQTKVVKPMPSVSLAANDTLWCSFLDLL